MKIYDCFTFFNELELLDLRLKELYNYVDYFVLVEATLTHTGKTKDLIFEKNKNKYSAFLDKIIHVKVNDLPDYNNFEGIWEPENFQRNCITRGLTNASEDDVILVSDIDEIPRPSAIPVGVKSLEKHTWVSCEQNLFYYYVNCIQNQLWRGTVFSKVKDASVPQDLRNSRDQVPHLKNAGWHYSFMGGSDRIIEKVNNIAESSLIIDKIKGKDDIEYKMKNQIDLWDRTESLAQKKIIPLNASAPNHIHWFVDKYPTFFYDEKRN
tara:strand:+ start:216 stop:1013 length:798 start_codon:yes stop_codon:yes gene_type:complete